MTDYDPNDATQHDHLDAVSAIIAAWSTPWADPAWQEQCQVEVQELMPALARSLDRLVDLMSFSQTTPIGTDSVHSGVEDVQPEAEVTDIQEEEKLDFATMTLEDLGQRAAVATRRIRECGSLASARELRNKETRIREQILVYLNNRDELSQPMIAKMVGIGAPRISQIISAYYDRLEYEEQK